METGNQSPPTPEPVGQAELTALDRAAVLMVALESEMPGLTNNVFSHLGEEKSKLMLRTIANLGRVGSDVVNSVVEEFFSIAIENKYVFGGEEVSSKILRDTFGVNPQDDFFAEKFEFFKFISKIGDEDLLIYFESENAQCVALIMNFLDPDRISALLNKMKIERAKEVSQLLIDIDIPNSHLIYEFQNLLEEKLTQKKEAQVSGEEIQINKMARALEMVSPGVRTEIFGILEDNNKRALARLKELIFQFKDLVEISDKDMETILYEVSDLRSLAISLRGCSETFAEKVENNISDRVKIMLDEETAALQDEIPEEETEEAQRNILKVARKLEKERKINKLIVSQDSEGEPASDAALSQDVEEKIELDVDEEG